MITKIDGAVVIEYTDKSSYGFVEIEDVGKQPIKRLAICRYDSDYEYYLFACDCNDNVIGDTIHNNIEDAKKFARNYYNMIDSMWKKIKED